MNNLIDVQDELAIAKNFVACIYMACESSMPASDERAALCAVSNAAREKLEAIIDAIDALAGKPSISGSVDEPA